MTDQTPPARRTIGVDFDGVIHSYSSGWQGDDSAPDPPVAGAIDWLNEITHDYDVAINSCRNSEVSGQVTVYNYLVENGVSPRAMGCITIPVEKPNAELYLDDRAWRFDGTNFPSADDVGAATPWYKSQ